MNETDNKTDLDRTGKKKPLLGGSLFSSASGPGAPPEIQPLVSLQIAVSKAVATTTSAVPTADTEYDKLTDPSKPTPTPPVHAARLSALVKSLASAEGAVSESIKARRGLIEGLEKMIENNRTALTNEEAQKETLTTRKNAMESKKRDVEDGIMRGLSADSTPAAQGSPLNGSSRANGNNLTPHEDLERPHVEELTPPPPESLTPAGSPTNREPESRLGQAPTPVDPGMASRTPSVPLTHFPTAGADLLSSFAMPPVRHYAETSSSAGGGPAKKRKIDDDFPGLGAGEDALADLDEDVAELLKQESGGAVPDKVYPL